MNRRKLRIVLGLIFLCLFLVVSMLPEQAGVAARKGLYSLQFSAQTTHIGGGLLIAALIFVSAAFLGRWYCGILCPAGLIQEVFHRLGGLLKLRRLAYAKPTAPRFRLVLIALTALAGTAGLINFLDPIGLYGRTALYLGEWASALSGQAEPPIQDGLSTVFFIAGFILLLVMPLFRGRWFCDSLCPVGAFLGLVAKTAPRGIGLDSEKCVSCGRCEKACQTRCLDARNKKADADRCVMCLDCLDACKFGALSVGGRAVEPKRRRTFLQASAAAAAGGTYLVARPLMGVLPLMPREHPFPVLPPGAGSPDRHQRTCITCQACVSACPVGIIRPAAPEMRPALDYDRGFCQYNCNECNASCPAGAFAPLTIGEKRLTRLAQTSLLLDRCVVIARGTACGACAEVCPTHAVRMVEREAGMPTIPDFAADYCIGCGACYHVCPAEPRAFRIEGIAEQSRALGIRPGGHAEHSERDGEAEREGTEEIADFPF